MRPASLDARQRRSPATMKYLLGSGLADGNRLDDAMFADGLGELVELVRYPRNVGAELRLG